MALLYWYIRHRNIDLKHLRKYQQPFPENRKRILTDHCHYYQVLSPRDKKKFEKRTHKFIINKRYIPKDMVSITEEMRVLIAATAVQLTFGLPEIHFEHFSRIYVYPERYFSAKTKSYNVGEVSTGGYIILSWKDFVRGHSDPTDSLNLGLHEMAHALKLENRIPNREFAFLNTMRLSKLNKITRKEMDKIRSGSEHFLRKYAGINDEEFFAVSIEFFFEKPAELKQEIPKLYNALSLLLNQDPARLYSS